MIPTDCGLAPDARALLAEVERKLARAVKVRDALHRRAEALRHIRLQLRQGRPAGAMAALLDEFELQERMAR